MNYERATLVTASVLRLLHKERQGAVEKIVLHKFIYFLNSQGFATFLKFEPYNYGPYSFDLAKEISSMIFWGTVKDSGHCVQPLDLTGYEELDSTETKRIAELFQSFTDIVKNDFSFKTLERVGTALYCALALNFQKKTVSAETILQEFKKWKGARYTDSQIKNTIASLTQYLPMSTAS